MKLEEALLRSDNLVGSNEGEMGKQDIEAIKLLIEAGKIVRFTRQNNFRLPLGLLPGETEE